eukprot:scaffold131035_cov54-Phaeocystis_antarctica.AAC.2
MHVAGRGSSRHVPDACVPGACCACAVHVHVHVHVHVVHGEGWCRAGSPKLHRSGLAGAPFAGAGAVSTGTFTSRAAESASSGASLQGCVR